MRLNLRKKTGSAKSILYKYGLVLFVVTFFVLVVLETMLSKYAGLTQEQSSKVTLLIFIIVPGVMLFYTWRYIVLGRALKRRDHKLAYYATSKKMSISQGINLSPSLYTIAEKKRDVFQRNAYEAEDWGYCDYEFSIYEKTKNDEYKSETFYYAIAAFLLPRKLPNVFFDARLTGKREFKMLFDSKQRHSLEGNFDNYFTSYFHQDYTVDNLSFITPEVMHSLIDAKQYDIEIYEDTLYLYNELEDMPSQLEDMETKGKKIRTMLLNNIMTYRDQRIAYGNGRKTVSFMGIKLKRSLKPFYISAVMGILLCILGVLAVIFLNINYDGINGLGFYLLVAGFVTLYSSTKSIKKIRREESFMESLKDYGA